MKKLNYKLWTKKNNNFGINTQMYNKIKTINCVQ